MPGTFNGPMIKKEAVNGTTVNMKINSGSANIDAGDIVKLADISTIKKALGPVFTYGSDIEIDANDTIEIHVFNIHSTRSLVVYLRNSNKYAYAQLINHTIDGVVTTLGVFTIDARTFTSGKFSVIQLSSTKFMYAGQLNGTATVVGGVINVSGDNVTVAGKKTIYSSSIRSNISFVRISDTKVVMGYYQYSPGYFTSRVINISGNTISVAGEQNVWGTFSDNSGYIDMVLLDTSRILYVYSGSSRSSYYANVLTVSGNSISIGARVSFTAQYQARGVYGLKISSTKVLVVGTERTGSSSGSYGYLKYLEINGNTITVRRNTYMAYQSYINYSRIQMPSGIVLFFGRSTSSSYSNNVYGVLPQDDWTYKDLDTGNISTEIQQDNANNNMELDNIDDTTFINAYLDSSNDLRVRVMKINIEGSGAAVDSGSPNNYIDVKLF